ncbi:MAG: hypothetical protein ACE5HE_01460, partial [Phycisphaerae bacterium]
MSTSKHSDASAKLPTRCLGVLLACAVSTVPAIGRDGPQTIRRTDEAPSRDASAREATETAGVFTSFRTYTTRDGLPHDNIRALRIFDGQVWVGTEGGLARCDAESCVGWTRAQGLPARVISAIGVDRDSHDLWLGTWGDGLVRFSAGRFDRYGQINSGLAGNLIFDVLVDAQSVWAATNAGLSLYTPASDTWELYFARRADRPEDVVTSLCTHAGSIYAATWRGNVLRYDPVRRNWTALPDWPSRMDPASAPQPAPSAPSVGITASGDSLWWASQTTLARRSGSNPWKGDIAPFTNQPGRYVHCLASSSEPQVWLGTDGGAHMLANAHTGAWLTYLRCDDVGWGMVELSRGGRTLARHRMETTLPDNRIRCIALAPGEVWLGTVRGLVHGTAMMRWSEFVGLTTPESGREGEDPTPADACTSADPRPTITGPVATSPVTQHPASIAVFGPRTRTVSLPGATARRSPGAARPDLLAVQLAMASALESDGGRDAPRIELLTAPMGYERYGWGTKEDDLTVFASDPAVAGVVGYITPDDVIADAVVFRTELPFVTVSLAPLPDDAPVQANPYLFRCNAGGPMRHRLLIDYLLDECRTTRLAILRTPNRNAQRHLDWWRRRARDRRYPVVADLLCPVEPGPSRSGLM